ncbi:MAG: hypothetical protein ACLR0U_22085 [Enterocloster clostridioformis]
MRRCSVCARCRWKNILNAIPPEETDQITEEEQERFEKLGRNVEFEYLALYNTERRGSDHLWEPLKLDNPDFFLDSLNSGEKDVLAIGRADGRTLYALWRFGKATRMMQGILYQMGATAQESWPVSTRSG